MKTSCIVLIFSFLTYSLFSQEVRYERNYIHTFHSIDGHGGEFLWKMKKAGDITDKSENISTSKISTSDWIPAIVPGTVLNSLVYNKVYPEPYFGVNNKLESGLIPDLYHAGRDFYTYWFRTEFDLDKTQHEKKRTWLQVDGINYRAEIWLNGNMVTYISGMFLQDQVDITDYIRFDQKNVLAIKVYPIDVPGTIKPKGQKSFGAKDEFQNGGNGEIGKNVTMLMTVGWDFTFLDGIRDRNTGIWKNISIFTTGDVKLRHPFVKSELRKPDYDQSRQTISVEINNPTYGNRKVKVVGEIKEGNIRFEKEVSLFRGEVKEVIFTPEEFPQLVINNPRLWWPLNKGKQELYHITFKTFIGETQTDEISSRFGIREITSDRNTPDKSRTFYINGKPIFIRGTNWIPENMLRLSDERTYAELRYTAQSGVNLIRFWGGGITESDYFFQLCDEMGIMVWTEFWMTGDTKHPQDVGLFLSNATSTIKRIRNYPSLAYYVCSNESTEMPHIRDLVTKLDGTRGYQMQSEVEGIHDGSPYKTVNVMRHYENTASDRGSRVDGFNPEYGAPCLPTVECLREMMPEKDLWPINKPVWDYSDGNGFHQMSTLYVDLTNQYGESNSIDEFAMKGQFVGALNYKSIWEVWNYNKLNYGDRYCSGFLYWYHNSAIRQVCGRMWDWSLEPTAALYAAQNACEPLHPQFDYLKNTVSVVNDFYQSFSDYKVTAEVYDLNMKKVFSKEAKVNLPEDGVANDIFKIDFPENITNVHFIKLRLFDNKGKQAGSSFYWRSNNKYEGKKTLTGPATAGFQEINNLKKTKVQVKYTIKEENGKYFISLNLKNTGKTLSFFTQVQWLDKSGKPVRPSFYTDNFISLLPGETAGMTIETNMKNLPDNEYFLVVKGFNVPEQRFTIRPIRK
ncbi:MAG: glycoside hydrolase family 2 [Bacteroidales bacterium]|jgi:mannosylglycoprotein endo-beta-mannosidase|nr:glycoside hydrolase family 2 [Bacteroidales bacterium]